MAVARLKTWVTGDILTASDLNAEYNNILNNGTSVSFPLTAGVSFGGFDVTNAGNITLNSGKSILFAGLLKLAQGTTLVSATTTDLSLATGNYVQISGTTTITGFGTVQAGTVMHLEFQGALQITHSNTKMILPFGGANITTAAGDTAIMVSEGGGNWRMLDYTLFQNQVYNGSTSQTSYTVGDLLYAANTTNAAQGTWTNATTLFKNSASGTYNLFSLVNSDGHTVGDPAQFTKVQYVVAQGQTGSPVYTYKYWNGAWVTLTTLTLPDWVNVGTSLLTFAAPGDWVIGGSEGTTITVTIATPAVVSYTAHGFLAGQQVFFTTTGALPTGLSVATPYFVIAAGLTANAFQVSASVGGAAINTTGSQSGTHTCETLVQTNFNLLIQASTAPTLAVTGRAALTYLSKLAVGTANQLLTAVKGTNTGLIPQWVNAPSTAPIVGSFTYDVSTASGTQVITPTGQTKSPTLVQLTASVPAVTGYSSWDGSDNGTQAQCVYSLDAQVNFQHAASTTSSIVLQGAAGTSAVANITTKTTTTFTLTWTKTGSPTGTATINYTVFF